MNSSPETNSRLIVVDDERDIVQSYIDFLTPETNAAPVVRSSRQGAPQPTAEPQGQEFEILTAYSGTQAIEIIQKEKAAGRRIAGGFFDMKMEGGPDGVQTIQEIWKIDPDLRCTIVTAYHDRSVRDIDLIFGQRFKDQWDYLNKPFTSGEIIQKARQMVANWNRERTLESALVQLKAAQEQLVKTERMAAIGQVARGIGHEFGNILQTIVGKADLALNSSNPEKVKDNLGLIINAADHAAFVVRNLQAFSKAEATRTSIDVSKVIANTLTLVNHNLTKRTIQLADKLGPAIQIVGNSVELQQVFMNLFINAMDAMPNGGTLEVGSAASGGKATAWVADTGTGIPADVLPRIFEYAFTTKGDKGSGLGLSISRQIIEAHGGAISVKSEPGKGTRFTIELPMAG